MSLLPTLIRDTVVRNPRVALRINVLQFLHFSPRFFLKNLRDYTDLTRLLAAVVLLVVFLEKSPMVKPAC